MGDASKIVGIMQPYFFPFFEQFRLIAACDLWIVFDTPQFSRKSWINRNRILNRDKGWTYLSIPVQHRGLGTPIKDALIATNQDWRAQLMDKLKVYQKEAPFYITVCDLVRDALAPNHETIAQVNTAILRVVCHYLKITTPVQLASELAFDLPERCAPGEWALHISKNLGATEYRNAAGGTALFDETLYAKNGIRLSFHEHCARSYATGSFEFVSDLSVIDWMMWNDPDVLRTWLA